MKIMFVFLVTLCAMLLSKEEVATMKTRRDFSPSFFLPLLVALLSFLLFPIPGFSQEYPTKPITIFCGFAAGASTDLTARGLASGLEKVLGSAVVVENKAGGGATVAAALVASKKPDGYILGVVSTVPIF
jgi:tripartite-type tricarboxylate transporter receptor subunit TctC